MVKTSLEKSQITTALKDQKRERIKPLSFFGAGIKSHILVFVDI